MNDLIRNCRSVAHCLVLFLSCLFSVPVFSQYSELPKREFRGAWIATVANTDFPKRPTPMRVAHREQYKNLLDKLKDVGLNAVIVQVRTAGDALYPSDHAPWSFYLTGRQGMAPKPDYDLLKFMIEEAHKRSMEFHAWFNPFRATLNLDTVNLAPNHVFKKHRDWVLKYGNRYYLNPALEAVQQHLIQVIMEVVAEYNIDAVHFDDYFYPYKIPGVEFPDTLFYNLYGKQRFKTIGDWRRANVDNFIQQLSSSIKNTKPFVKFGISPFGVWRNKERDQMGSDTRAGVTTYDDLYADVLKWLKNGWVDYVIPQLYWNIGYPPADHEKLVKWWSAHVGDRHLYIGHAAYKIGTNQEIEWDDPEEIPRQIKLNRRNFYTIGSAYFSANTLLRNRLGVRDSVSHYYAKPALIPEMEELSDRTPSPPVLKRIRKKRGAPKLVWKVGKKDRELDKFPTYYAVYRFKNDNRGPIDDANYLLTVTPFHRKGKKFKFVDKTTEPDEYFTYVITALNRMHSESTPSNSRTIFKLNKGFSRVK